VTRKPFFPSKTVALYSFAMMLLLAAYPMLGSQATASNQAEASHRSYDAEMNDHENELKAFLTKLRLSFQAVTDSTDGNDHVNKPAVVKQHEDDIVALRGAVRDHHLFAIPTGHQCRPDNKEHANADRHQVRMEAVLSSVGSTFEDYKRANESPTPGTAQKALDAHRQSLHDFAGAIDEHKAILTALQKCP
jgi:hypothetical protein